MMSNNIKMGISKKTIDKFFESMGLRIKDFDFGYKDVRTGFNIEKEHGKINKYTNVTNNNRLKTFKIALAHLLEHPKYYVALVDMEKKLEQGYYN